MFSVKRVSSHEGAPLWFRGAVFSVWLCANAGLIYWLGWGALAAVAMGYFFGSFETRWS